MPKLRQDPLSGDWISLSGDRQVRPLTVASDNSNPCPFCPGDHSEVGLEPFAVAVFDNRFPAFDAPGKSEIVVYSPDHWADLATLLPTHAQTVWSAWVHRTESLNARPDIHHVFIFENRGSKVGASIAHPHGQIYGYPFIPPRMVQEIDRWPQDHCPLCQQEGPDLETRTLLTTSSWQLIAPWAARMPFQLTLYPRRHHPDLVSCPLSTGYEAMAVIQAVYRAYDAWFGHRTALVLASYQAPGHVFARDRYHLRFDFLPIERGADKIKYLAGSELGMGAFVGDMLPETVARSLRPLVQAAYAQHPI
ncbi:MAG: hypothetical protein M1415_00595 [Firmicutes bacterium]|jgi:UDPglucose--hexose-1-phosphate uridylyltransferase|nr:hypothetical protein [Bacillota bacterium]MCL5066602.1 hypothetical protein [Bacillota bacterium]